MRSWLWTRERKHLALQHGYTSTHGNNSSSSQRASVNHNHHMNRSSRKQSCTSCHLPQSQCNKDHLHSNVNNRTAKAHYTRTQVRVTKMLLLVSSAFLALNLPRHTVRAYSVIMSTMDKNYSPSANHIVWDRLFRFLYYLQFSVNVFLYSAFGKNFRKALRHLGRKIKHKLKECHNSVVRKRPQQMILTTTRSEVVVKDYSLSYLTVDWRLSAKVFSNYFILFPVVLTCNKYLMIFMLVYFSFSINVRKTDLWVEIFMAF